IHHIATDGRSMAVFWDELARLYEGFTVSGAQPLPALPLDYGDFAAWQRDWLSGPDAAAQLAYWRRALAGAPEVSGLPPDLPRPASRSGQGAQHRFRILAEHVRRLRALGAEEGATLF